MDREQSVYLSVADLVAPPTNLCLTFKDLTYKVKVSKKETKTILHGLSSDIFSNKLTAIMGASGSGKTTLLNSISGQAYDSNITIEGTLLLNSKPITKKEQRDWAFVFQDDVILETMTVREALYMSAKLRLPKNTTEEERLYCIESLLDSLNLRTCENTMVGDTLNRGISGGERKRLSIAMELVRNPDVIMLDEPTSGLDTYTAYSVIKQLKDLSMNSIKENIVVSTIHQPSSDIFHLFDDLILLHDGKIMYAGEVKKVLDYFSALDFTCPSYTNPADYIFMFVLNKAPINEDERQTPVLAEERLTRLQQAFKEKRLIKDSQNLLEYFETSPVSITSGAAINKEPKAFITGFWNQFLFLFKRTFKNTVRNKLVIQIKFYQTLIISLFVGLTYLNIPAREGAAQVQDRAGVLFFMVVNAIFSSSFGVLNVFSAEKNVFVREYRGRYYGLPAYFLSKTLIEMPFNLVFPMLSSVIVYFMAGLRLSAANFFVFAAILILTSTIGMSLGLLFASAVKNLSVSLNLSSIILLPCMIFSGLYVNTSTLPVFLKWMQYISPMKYGFQAAMINEFTDLPLPSPIESGNVVLKQFGITNDDLGLSGNIVVLIAFFIGLCTLSYFALLRITHQYKKSVIPKPKKT